MRLTNVFILIFVALGWISCESKQDIPVSDRSMVEQIEAACDILYNRAQAFYDTPTTKTLSELGETTVQTVDLVKKLIFPDKISDEGLKLFPDIDNIQIYDLLWLTRFGYYEGPCAEGISRLVTSLDVIKGTLFYSDVDKGETLWTLDKVDSIKRLQILHYAQYSKDFSATISDCWPEEE